MHTHKKNLRAYVCSVLTKKKMFPKTESLHYNCAKLVHLCVLSKSIDLFFECTGACDFGSFIKLFNHKVLNSVSKLLKNFDLIFFIFISSINCSQYN